MFFAVKPFLAPATQEKVLFLSSGSNGKGLLSVAPSLGTELAEWLAVQVQSEKSLENLESSQKEYDAIDLGADI